LVYQKIDDIFRVQGAEGSRIEVKCRERILIFLNHYLQIDGEEAVTLTSARKGYDKETGKIAPGGSVKV
jgi:hypothetical protein